MFRVIYLLTVSTTFYDTVLAIISTYSLQVLDWLSNHGEVFIRKNTGIGRNLQKARVYQKSHEHFENVAQVSVSSCTVSYSCGNHLN